MSSKLAIDIVTYLVTVGCLLNGLELIWSFPKFRFPHMLGLRDDRARYSPYAKTVASNLSALFVFKSLVGLSVILCVTLIVCVVCDLALARKMSLVLLALCCLYFSWFKVVGGDGADQMRLIVVLSLALTSLLDVEYLALWFLAFQGMLAYATSGFAKLVSPLWRSGLAIGQIVSTINYGTRWFAELVSRHQSLGRILTWTTLFFECAAPLSISNPKVATCFVLVAFSFHCGVAVIMGLGQFIWAFSCALVSIYYVSTKVHLIQ